MVGGAIVRTLRKEGYENLLLRTRMEVNLTDQAAVMDLFNTERPEYVFLAAAKVGGIHANNTYRGAFIYENLVMCAHIIEAARVHGVKKLLFLGSSCIYPRNCPQPIKEEYLLTGELEATNEPYAIAKIAGIKLCENYRRQYSSNFISAMPTNLYGPGDNYDPENSHVVAALIRKFHYAKEHGDSNVTIWGTGTPLREFLFVDDLAEACVFLMKNYDGEPFVNVGVGKDIAIKDLALLIKDLVGFNGELVFDTEKPDGTPRKILNVDRIHALGWRARHDLKSGLRKSYQAFLAELAAGTVAER